MHEEAAGGAAGVLRRGAVQIDVGLEDARDVPRGEPAREAGVGFPALGSPGPLPEVEDLLVR